MPRFIFACAKFGSAASACSKLFCASADLPWFIYATPNVFRRSASLGNFLVVADVFGCAVDCIARERNSEEKTRNPKHTKLPTTTNHRRNSLFMESIEESSFWTRDDPKKQLSSLRLSGLPAPSSTVFVTRFCAPPAGAGPTNRPER